LRLKSRLSPVVKIKITAYYSKITKLKTSARKWMPVGSWSAYWRRSALGGKNLNVLLPLSLGYGLQLKIKIDIRAQIVKLQQQIIWPFKKHYQKTIAAVLLVSIISVSFFLFSDKNSSVQAASYHFIQTSWLGGATSTNATHPGNQSGWNYFSTSTSGLALNGDGSVTLASSTGWFMDDGATSSNGSLAGGGWANGTSTNIETSGAGAAATIKLAKVEHVNEYTIGNLANINATVSTVEFKTNGAWKISFSSISSTTAFMRIFKNDKFTDSAGHAWKVISMNASTTAPKIIVIDSEENFASTTPSTGPATGAGATIGRWYNSIANWETGRQGNLVARKAIERGLCYYDGTPDTTAVTIDGWTTDATHYIEITVPLSERHRGKWDDGKYKVISAEPRTLYVRANHVKIKGLQVENTGDMTNGAVIGMEYSGVGVFEASDNILKAVNGAGTSNDNAIDFTSANGQIMLKNNVIYKYGRAFYWYYGSNIVSGAIYNNTIVDCSVTGIHITGSAANNNIFLKNNIVQGSVTNYSLSNMEGTANNLSMDATSPDVAYRNQTVNFISTSTKDFHLAFNDVSAKNAGADLTAEGVMTDIDGDIRAGAWDIGADDVGATYVHVNSIGTNSRDFSTLQAWEDARDGVLTTRQVFKITAQSGAFQDGETISNGSGVSGTYVKERDTPSAVETYMTLDNVIGGSFSAGNTLTGASSTKSATLSEIVTTTGTIENGEAYNDSVFTAGITISGSTVNSSHYMRLIAEPRSEHRGVVGTGVTISANTFSSVYLYDDYSIIERLIIDKTGMNNSALISYSSRTGLILRNNLIFKSPGSYYQANDGINIACNSSNSSIYNNIVYGFGQGIAVCGNSDKVYNNTSMNSVNGFYRNGNSPELRNNAGLNNTTDFNINSGAWHASSSNNLSSDSAAPGVNSKINQYLPDLKFVSTDPDFIDLHLASGSSAKDAGADLSVTFVADLDNQIRSGAWDIGADEFWSNSPLYNSSGVFESAIIDLGAKVDLTTLSWNPASHYPNSSLKVQAAVSDDPATTTWNYIDLNEESYPAGVTAHTSYVRPSGQCAGYSPCYNSLSAWEAAQQRNLVASNEIEVAQIGGSWADPDTAAVTIDGWTTGVNNYIKIYTASDARHEGRWSGLKYRLQAGGNIIAVAEENVRIDGLQIYHTTNAQNPAGIFVAGATGMSDVRISDCVIRGYGIYTNGGAGGAIWFNAASSSNYRAWNNILYDFNNNIDSGISGIRLDGGNLFAFNNTINNCRHGLGNYAGNVAIAQNNIVSDCTTPYIGTFSSGTDYNATDINDDIGQGTHNKINQIFSFFDEDNDDFRLSSFDTAAKDAGADLSSDPYLDFGYDILGHARTGFWDIGAHEAGAIGGNLSDSLDSHRYLRYKIYFSTIDISQTPALNDVTINFVQYPVQAFLVSSVYDSGDVANIFANLSWTATTSSLTAVKFQIRTASTSVELSAADWVGPDGATSTYFTLSAGGEVQGGQGYSDSLGDRWFQYRAVFESDGAGAPTLSAVDVTYVVNAPPEIQNIAAVQIATSTDPYFGQVKVSYDSRDIDTDTGGMAGKVDVSLEYCSANCSSPGSETWASAASTSLAGDFGPNVSVNLASTTEWTGHILYWNVRNDYPNIFNNVDFKIRLVANDHEAANNLGHGTSNQFILDTKIPTLGSSALTINAKTSNPGSIPADVYLSSTDDTSLEMQISLNNVFSGASWIPYSATNSVLLATDPDTVYARFRDQYGNIATAAPATTPEQPGNAIIRDVSNMSSVPATYQLFLAWAGSSLPNHDFSEYAIYRATSSMSVPAPDNSQFAILATSTKERNYYLDMNLNANTYYFYKVYTKNANGDISRFSPILSEKADGQGGTDTTPPTISSVQIVATTTQSAAIEWDTDELANSTIGYSQTSGDFSNETGISGYADRATSTGGAFGRHRVVLSNLTPNTTYYFQVKSADPYANQAADSSGGGGYMFTTKAGPAINPPPTPEQVDNFSVTISWTTDKEADSNVVYSPNADMSSTTLVQGVAGERVLQHRVRLTGLSQGTRYYYYITSTDDENNTAIDDNAGEYYFFVTNNDTEAPVISGIATSTDDVSSVIQWATDERAAAQVFYGIEPGNYTASTTLNENLNLNHAVNIVGLTPKTTYYFFVVSTDANQNTATSSEYSFITLDKLSTEEEVKQREAAAREEGVDSVDKTGGGILIIPPPPMPVIDKTAPVILNVRIEDIRSDSAIVRWETEEESTSITNYEAAIKNYELRIADERFSEANPDDFITKTKSHHVRMTRLQPDSEYSYYVISTDASGNTAQSEKSLFRTLTVAEEIRQATSSEEKVSKDLFDNAVEMAKNAMNVIKNLAANVSINVLEDTADSLADLADFVPPPLMSGEPKIVATTNSANIGWQTDKDSNSLIAIAADEDFKRNGGRYNHTVGQANDKTKIHEVEMNYLSADTLYHIQLISKSAFGQEARSRDFIFRTRKEALEITNLTFQNISPSEVSFRWTTSVETDAAIKYTPYRGNVLAVDQARTKTDTAFSLVHEMTLTNLEPGTVYQMELSGKDIKKNSTSKIIPAFSTGKDEAPPAIDQLQADMAIPQGKAAKVQAIISWVTDEPSTSQVFFQKGFAQASSTLDSMDKTQPDQNYTKKHVAVITKFEPGAVYSVRVKSIDSSGNVAISKTHVVLAPKQRETVFQIIMKNFEQIFGWVGNVR